MWQQKTKSCTYFFLLLHCILSINALAQQGTQDHKTGKFTEGYFIEGTSVNLEDYILKNLEVNQLKLQDNSELFISDGISTSLYYVALKPTSIIKGSLVLLSGTSETPADVLNNNKTLIKQAYENGLLLLVPSINNNLILDSLSLALLNTSITDAINKYKLSAQKFIIGGFSLGGMTAIRYTELAFENKNKTIIQPLAVYAIDSPLDFSRLYTSFSKIARDNFFEPASIEARNYLQKMNAAFGGPPTLHEEIYSAHSMFSKSAKDGGNARFLKSVPVRVYCDPDTAWWMKNRKQDQYDMNAFDQTAFINYLTNAGNQHAEYINCLGKGLRLNGNRHPHSWSIADPEECMKWLMHQFDNN